jgi:hypothetical protein
MDSLDDDEFDKMVEINIRQLQVDSGSGTTAAVAPSTMSVPAATPPTVMSPRLMRRAQLQQQQQLLQSQPQQQQYGYTSGDTSRTTASIRSQGPEMEIAKSPTSRSTAIFPQSTSRQGPSTTDNRRPQQQQQQQENKDEESEDELSK